MSDPEILEPRLRPLPRMLKSDIRPMERCCGHHLLAHDAFGCLITGCDCQLHTPEAEARSALASPRLEALEPI